MRRFELVEGGSSKFWEVAVEGATLTVRYGRIGTQGQTQSKALADAARAAAERDKLVREKTGKGYAEVALAAGAVLPAVAPKTLPAAATPTAAAPAPAPTPAPAPLPAASPQPSPVTVPQHSTASATEAAPPTPAPMAPAPAIATATAVGSPEPADFGPEPQPPGVFLWQPAWRRELAPWRGTTLPPVTPLDAAALRQQIDAQLARHTQFVLSLKPALAPTELDRLLDLEDPSAPLSRTPTERAAWELLLEILQALGASREQPLTLAHGWQLAAALHGLPFAVEQLLQRLRGLGPDPLLRLLLQPKLGLQAEALQLRVAHASAEEHGLLLSLLQSATGTESPVLAVFAAWLVPTEATLLEAALAAIEASRELDSSVLALLSACRMSTAQAERLLALRSRCRWVSQRTLVRLALSFARQGLESALLTALQLFSKTLATPEHAEDYFAMRRALDTPAALARLFTAFGRKEAQPHIDQFAHAWPALALRLLAEWLAGRSEPHPQAQLWLRQFAQAHAAELPAAIARSAGAARALLQGLEIKLQTRAAEVALEALPEWLRCPPWRVKGRKARPPYPKLGGSAPLATHWAWNAGEQDRWLDGQSPERVRALMQSHRPQQPLEPQWILSEFGFDGPTISALLSGQTPAIWPPPRWRWHALNALLLLPPACAARILETRDPTAWYDFGMPLETVVAWLGEAATAAVESMAEKSAERGLALAQPLASPRIAGIAATALRHTRRAKVPAQRWLLRHASYAATCLLPRLSEGTGSADAAHALRWLLANGREEAVAQAAAGFGAPGAQLLKLLVEFDPMQLAPMKIPALPAFWLPAGFTRPELRSGGALPLSSLAAIGEMLAFTSLDQRYEGLERLRALCTPRSLGAFAWDLFQAWLSHGGPMKEAWGMQALAHLGDDACAHGFAKLLRGWPSEGSFGRATAGLDVLAAFGSEVALMLLHGISQRVKSKPLQAKAQQCLAQLAELRGLDAEQLADRLVPDLDLAEDGTLSLDFGPRAFTVGFDEHLKPLVRDAEGKPLKDLPAPNRADDPARAEAATASWKALKKNVRALASQQIQRLERAMIQRRRWSAAEFQQYFVRHPLLRHLVRRLLWAVCAPADGGVLHGLRVAEDLSFADHDDALLTLSDDAVIGLPHPLELSAAQLAAFGQIFADYEIAQPFAQLGREVFRLTAEEESAFALTRFEGKRVATGSVFGLLERGWQRNSDDDDGGWLGVLSRPLGEGMRALFVLEPGAAIGDVKSNPVQTLGALELAGRGEQARLPWQRVQPILVSEVLRDVARMAAVKG